MLHKVFVESSCHRVHEEFTFTDLGPVPKVGETYIDQSDMPWTVTKVSMKYVETKNGRYDCVSHVKVSNV